MPYYRRRSRLPYSARAAASMTLLWSMLAASLYLSPASYRRPLVPCAFVFGALAAALWVLAVVEVWLRTRREHTRVQLTALEPSQFERWVAQRFCEQGYAVTLTGMAGDHGVDLVVMKDGQRAVVQCKKYANWRVGEPALRDLYGAMHDFGASHAFMVTTGPVTEAARAWARGKPITIIDGRQLSQWAGAAPIAPAPVQAAPAEAAPSYGFCTQCGAALVVKHNRRTGEPFLACPNFPRCRFTRPMPR